MRMVLRDHVNRHNELYMYSIIRWQMLNTAVSKVTVCYQLVLLDYFMRLVQQYSGWWIKLVLWGELNGLQNTVSTCLHIFLSRYASVSSLIQMYRCT